VNGAVNGTVSGTIVLPNGNGTNGTFAASSVTIDAYPAALNLGPPPIVSFSAGIIFNTFMVSGGDITSGELLEIFLALSTATQLFS
jgi:hypothetical protein